MVSETLNIERIKVFIELCKSLDPEDKYGIITDAEKVIEQEEAEH